MLKLIIRGRKTAYFYKTLVGAGVADVLISIIATAKQANIDIMDYLVKIQRHQAEVKADPLAWLPWNYHSQLERQKQAA